MAGLGWLLGASVGAWGLRIFSCGRKLLSFGAQTATGTVGLLLHSQAWYESTAANSSLETDLRLTRISGLLVLLVLLRQRTNMEDAYLHS